MARRASSKTNPMWIGGAVLLAIVAIAGGFHFYGKVSDPYRTIAPLELKEYLDNANSLRGNVYKVDGTVLNQLAWSPKVGRLYSIEVKSATTEGVLPVLVPAEFNQVNLQKGQQFHFRVEVGENGVVKAQGLDKI